MKGKQKEGKEAADRKPDQSRMKAKTKPTPKPNETRAKAFIVFVICLFIAMKENSQTKQSSEGSLVFAASMAKAKNERPPQWSESQFTFKAEKIGDWLDMALRVHGLAPGQDGFCEAFEHRWQMSYDYWIAQRDRHVRYFAK